MDYKFYVKHTSVREKTNKTQQLDVYYQHFLSHPTTQRPTTATNHIQQNQLSTPRAVTHVLLSWRWA